MAFPASPSNNQVHKEGNRSFVYDSTLGVWDQVRETDITDGKNLYGEIDRVTYPAGHVVQVATKLYSGSAIAVGQTYASIPLITLKFTPKSSSNNIMVQIWFNGLYTTTSNAGLRAGIKWSVDGWTSETTLGTSLYLGGYVNYGQGARKAHASLTTPVLAMPSTAGEIEFRIYCQMNSGSMNINQDGSGNDTTLLICHEIQA